MASPAVAVTMPTLVPGLTDTRHCRGFTLLELLVVLVIAGILLGAVALNAMPGGRQLLQDDAQRIALLLQTARDEAIVRNRAIAFEADDQRYRFLIRQNDNWQVLTNDALLRERTFRHVPVSVTLLPATADRLPVRIVFGREPVDKPFALRLAAGVHSVTIQADGIGHFRVQ
jgi:general secretion pathway protein H